VSSAMARFGSAAIAREFKPEPVRRHMAVRVSGTFTTAFPGGRPESAPEGEEPDTEAGEPDAGATGLTEGESTVLLVADSDMIHDRFCVEALNFFGATAHRPMNDNINFFANAVEQMSGSADLIGIRSRGEFVRPFDRVLALEQEARRKWQEKEQSLVQTLQETRRQLSQLQSEKDQGQKFILSPEQKEAIARFRADEIRINRELKDVRKNLRSDIERLGVEVKVANILLMPLLIGAFGIGYGIHRATRARRGYTTAQVVADVIALAAAIVLWVAVGGLLGLILAGVTVSLVEVVFRVLFGLLWPNAFSKEQKNESIT